MEPLEVVAGVAFFTFVTVLLVHIHSRSPTASDTDSSDEETSGPLNVNVIADHDEQDSLLPKFAGLLLSPWHNVTIGQMNQPQMMRPVQKKRRFISLTMSLPIGKKKATEVPMKKVHVPYFFPLLDETAEWWQTHQSTVAESTLTLEQDFGAGVEDNLHFSDQKEETQTPELLPKELLQSEQSHHFLAAKLTDVRE